MKSVIYIYVLNLILIKTFTVKGVSKYESKIEMKAVLLSCPTRDTGCEDDDLLSQAIKAEESQMLEADSKISEFLMEEAEEGFTNEVRDCKKKLLITLKIKNAGRIPCDDEYIVVDHVFDPVTGGRGRLLSPVVVKLRQEQMTHLYGLQFQKVVNSDPFEEQKPSGRSCSVSPDNPTCGITTYDGKPIPFSQGFCCSCDSHADNKRQLSSSTRAGSLFYHDNKMIPKENFHFIRDQKVAIVDPNLVKLNFRNSRKAQGKKKSVHTVGFGDPPSWEKIPNYLLEHDRKVICEAGDFMDELCKLQEDKYYSESASSFEYQGTDVIKERNKKSADFKRAVDMEEAGLKKEDVTTVAAGIETSKENFLKDEKAHDANLPKNFIETLNWNQNRETNALADNYGSVKGSRGKRENRDENKNLNLDEKLERFVNSKSYMTNPRKRLLALPHKRRRKAEGRCLRGQECATVSPQEYPADDYVSPPPPEFFFFHDKYIINPLDLLQYDNTTCVSSQQCPYEPEKAFGKDRPTSFDKKNSKSQEENVNNYFFYERQQKQDSQVRGKDRITLGKLSGKKDRVSENEKEKIENSFGGEEIRAQNFDEPLKISPFARSDKRHRLFKDLESREKDEEADAQEDYNREQKFNRLSSKTFKNFFHKSDSYENFINPKKIRNFLMAKSHERPKLKSELDSRHKKLKFHHRDNELLKIKNFKESENKGSDAEYFEKKRIQDEKNVNNKLIKEQERDEDQRAEATKELEGSSHPKNFPKYSFSELMDMQKQREKEKLKGIGETGSKIEENEKTYGKQYSEKITDFKHNYLPKEFSGDTDFSFEIIRRNYPDYSKAKYYSTYEKLMSNNRESNAPHTMDTTAFNHKQKFSQEKYNPNTPALSDSPQNYYVLQNKLVPPQMYVLRNDRRRFSGTQNYMRHSETPQETFYDSMRLRDRPEPELNDFVLKKPSRRHHYSEYNDYSNDMLKSSQSFKPVIENKMRHGPDRGRRFSDLSRRHENGYMKVGFQPQTFESDLRLRMKKVRSKRSASNFFQPASEFFKSEFSSRGPEDRIVQELEASLPEPKAKTRSARPGSWQFSRMNRENMSIETNGNFNSPRFRIGYNCPAVKKSIKTVSDKQRLIQSYLNAPDYVLKEVKAALKEKRQVAYAGALNGSRRDESSFSPEPDAEEIAHCMRFGDMWYNLYSIKEPVVSQTVGIQLFDKHLLWDGTTQWRDLTKGKMIRVGTYLPKAEDDLPSVSVNFFGGYPEKSESAIDPENYFLLIPSHVSDSSKMDFYPQFGGGPGEYLLVQSKDVSSGGECNMVGTSFEAFARQPNRCNQRKGSCLKRQPVDLWREDMEARIRGKRGKYFVENFGNIPNSFVKTYTNYSGEFLALEYYGNYTSTIKIEIKADSNAIIRKGSIAQIPLVYIDGTYPNKTRIILSVLNIGLTSSYFRPRLGDCPPDLDPAWCPLEGPLVIIHPQQRHDFKLDLSGGLPSHQIFVGVQVLNQVNKKIASRKIYLKKGNRCVCAFHCKCNCFGHTVNNKACQKLSLREYRRAGYVGPFPFRGGSASFTTESFLKNIQIVFFTSSYVLLLFGVVKGVLGIIFRRVGILGIRVITGPRQLLEYYESELKECSVLFDQYGFPVHPTTCQPVQMVPLWLETIINFFFFFLYPSRGFWILLSSLPCCKALCSECDGCGRNNDNDSDQKSSLPLLPKRIHPTCVHYNLPAVNSKNMKKVKHLPYLKYKGDEDPLEEDDTEFVLQEMKRYRK